MKKTACKPSFLSLWKHRTRFFMSAYRRAVDTYIILCSEAAECIPRYFVYSAYLGDAAAFVQRIDYLRAVIDEKLQFCATAFASSQNDTLFLPQFKSFARTHRYEVAFEFCDETECEAENFAVYRVVECVTVFRTVK